MGLAHFSGVGSWGPEGHTDYVLGPTSSISIVRHPKMMAHAPGLWGLGLRVYDFGLSSDPEIHPDPPR